MPTRGHAYAAQMTFDRLRDSGLLFMVFLVVFLIGTTSVVVFFPVGNSGYYWQTSAAEDD